MYGSPERRTCSACASRATSKACSMSVGVGPAVALVERVEQRRELDVDVVAAPRAAGDPIGGRDAGRGVLISGATAVECAGTPVVARCGSPVV